MTAQTGASADPLAEAADYLILRGFYGLVWLDSELMVTERRGRLVDFVKTGYPVGLAIPHLFGLDAQLQAVRCGDRTSVELLNIAMIEAADRPPRRLNFYIHWMAGKDRFLVIVARTTNQDELEAEIENQSRRTALAEAKLMENAKQIAQANTELKRANRELSEFAYVISHDLKAPMRAMRYQVEDIEAAVKDGNQRTTQALLDGLKRQERRMSGMLTDLLAYARIGRAEDALTLTDTRALIEAIVASMPRPPAFQITIGEAWPTMELATPALDLVLRNLVDNAIKHHDHHDGRLDITACPRHAGIDIRIADDGPGIPQSFHAIIFQPFRKVPVENRETPEGSGIGLALVRKMAESAGARLTLESDPASGRGTTFHLFWPGRIAG